jgi:hypothetical protein
MSGGLRWAVGVKDPAEPGMTKPEWRMMNEGGERPLHQTSLKLG